MHANIKILKLKTKIGMNGMNRMRKSLRNSWNNRMAI